MIVQFSLRRIGRSLAWESALAQLQGFHSN